jgi:hypothetical protein
VARPYSDMTVTADAAPVYDFARERRAVGGEIPNGA